VDNPRFDISLGAVSACVGFGLLIPSYREEARVFMLPGDISPYLVPKVFLYCWIVLSLGILIKGVIKLRADNVDRSRYRWSKIAFTFAICLCATALMKPLGYVVVAPVAVFLSIQMMGYGNHWLNGIVSLVTSVSLYILLVQVASLSLPEAFWHSL